MLLNLENSKHPMKIVYLLSEELRGDPDQVALTQALTLDPSRPAMGLKGANGLFGSSEWWSSIEQGKMRLLHRSGTITRTYVAGQDPSPVDNCFSLLLDDGSVIEESIYSHIDDEDKKLFRPGAKVDIVYALDELKRTSANGDKCYSDIVLEIAISLQPIK
ncbi:hypothetical protein [Pectobacterium versatile]|uniref:hypothetical protein n=1 Tax=Pectobacterium versatile TaxID=2488639 RepID=UPI001CF5AC46|nr:hypothetical protein [Pectobacterium versatile]MCA6914729.1 hypothetical protein [Pectobacterium versatile]GKV83455.1 hypothetical protein PEC106664_42290 [Pectobacterium carotovorum subsp. carotovorum]